MIGKKLKGYHRNKDTLQPTSMQAEKKREVDYFELHAGVRILPDLWMLQPSASIVAEERLLVGAAFISSSTRIYKVILNTMETVQ